MPERLLVLSERAAYMADLSRMLKHGDVVEGTVRKLTDYGAFVSIRAADGSQHGTDVTFAVPATQQPLSKSQCNYSMRAVCCAAL